MAPSHSSTRPYGDNLPLFPTFYTTPTAMRLQFVIERLTDNAGRALLAGKASRAEYDAWAKALDVWASKVKTAS